jgi:hypothetical protein
LRNEQESGSLVSPARLRCYPSVAAKVAAAAAFVSVSKGKRMKTKKCPVCDWEIKDGGIKVKVGGKEITVCCDDCAKKAKASPAQYAGEGK